MRVGAWDIIRVSMLITKTNGPEENQQFKLKIRQGFHNTRKSLQTDLIKQLANKSV